MEKKSLRKIKKWIIAAAIFTQTLGSAYGNLNFQAGAMEDGTFLLTVNGSISSGDAYIFAKQIDSFKQDNMPLSQIWLNSLGGNVADALKMSLIISSNNLTLPSFYLSKNRSGVRSEYKHHRSHLEEIYIQLQD